MARLRTRTEDIMATKDTPSLTIGVIFFGDKRAEFFDQIWEGMMTFKIGLPSDTKLIRKTSDFTAQSQVECIDQLEKDGIQGLIIAPYNDPLVAKRLKKLTDAGTPVVCVNSDIPDSGRICYVGPDPYQSGVVAAEILQILAQDKGEIGIITGSRLLVKPQALGLNICAFVSISLSEASKYAEVVESLKKIRPVFLCNYICTFVIVLIYIFPVNADYSRYILRRFHSSFDLK